MCFFPRILESLPPLPRQHSAAIGCKKIGASHIALRALKFSYSDVGEGVVAVSCEKNKIFPEHLVCVYMYNCLSVEKRMVTEINWGLGKSTNPTSNIKVTKTCFF